MNAIRLPFNFNVSKIREEISSIDASLYKEICSPYIDFGHLISFQLMDPDIDSTLSNDKTHFIPNKYLKNRPYLTEIVSSFQSDKETYRIQILKSKGNIRRHRDIGLNLKYGTFRLHIPVLTNDEVVFTLKEQEIRMKEGECWYLNFHLAHDVVNNSIQDRIHLIIDCKINDWWHKVFKPFKILEDTNIYQEMSVSELISMKIGLEEINSESSKEILRSLALELERRER